MRYTCLRCREEVVERGHQPTGQRFLCIACCVAAIDKRFGENLMLIECVPCAKEGIEGVEAVMYVGKNHIPMCDTCWPLADPALRSHGVVRVEQRPAPKSFGLPAQEVKPLRAKDYKGGAPERSVDLDAFRRDYEGGMLWGQLSEKHGIPKGSIQSYVKKSGADANVRMKGSSQPAHSAPAVTASQWAQFLEKVRGLDRSRSIDIEVPAEGREGLLLSLRQFVEKHELSVNFKLIRNADRATFLVTHIGAHKPAEVSVDTCKCGKELHHRGRCSGAPPSRRVNIVKSTHQEMTVEENHHDGVAQDVAALQAEVVELQKQLKKPAFEFWIEPEQMSRDVAGEGHAWLWGAKVPVGVLDAVWYGLADQTKADLLSAIAVARYKEKPPVRG